MENKSVTYKTLFMVKVKRNKHVLEEHLTENNERDDVLLRK